MTGVQKALLVVGLVALAASSAVAPYRWTGHQRFLYGGPLTDHGVLYHPLWAEPSLDDIMKAWRRSPDLVEAPTDMPVGGGDASASLDAGRLAIWWGAIAAVTTVAVLLAAPRRSR